MATPIIKDEKLLLNKCPQNILKQEQMKDISYALRVGSLMYSQFRSRPDILFVVRMFDKYQSNPSLVH